MESEIGALIKLTIVNKRDKFLLLQIQCQKGILVRLAWGFLGQPGPGPDSAADMARAV